MFCAQFAGYGCRDCCCKQLLSGKLQNGRKIHLEALLNRTSGFLFQKASPKNLSIMMIGFAAWGQDKKRKGVPKARCPKKASALSLWKKNRPLLLLLSVQTPRGACCCRANISRLGGRASLEAVPTAGIRQSRDGFSKSKSVCAGGSGKVPRLCAI